MLRPFPVFPVSTLIYMRCFHVWLLVHLPCFPCCASSVQLYPSFLSRYLLLFYSLCPSFFISPLCTAPDTCPIFSLCAFHPGTFSSLSSFLSFLSPSLGFPFPLCVFSASLPHLPGAIPPFLRSFPLLRFPLRKKFPLKSRVISSVKYMFYSIFLVCLGKFS